MLNGVALNTVALDATSVIPPPYVGFNYALNGKTLNSVMLAGSAPVVIPLTGLGTLISFEQSIAVPNPLVDTSGFSLNKRPLNADKLAGSEVVAILGIGTLITIEQHVGEHEGGNLIAISQSVGKAGVGTLLTLEQNVILNTVAEGTLVTFVTNVQAVAGNLPLWKIEQNVIENNVVSVGIPTYLQRNKWDAILIVGGNHITTVTDKISITRTENGAALMDVVILTTRGVQPIDQFIGQVVTLDIQTPTTTRRIYTGVVDFPVVDIIQRTVTLRCTDRRKELINAQLSTTDPTTGVISFTAALEAIGYGSSILFPVAVDAATELSNRLTTVPMSVDFDAYGIYTLSNLAAKPTADFVLTNPNIFYSAPKIEYLGRARIINNVTVKFDYRYGRLWHLERDYTWLSPIATNFCLFIQDAFTMTNRAMITTAVNGTGWPLKAPINFRPIPPGGFYCGAFWSPVKLTGISTPLMDNTNATPVIGSDGFYVFDANGNQELTGGVPVLDSAGKQVMENTITGGTDYSLTFCTGATWMATKRWSQTITESYTLVVTAPQSIAQYGIVDKAVAYNYADPSDVTFWSKYTAYNNPYNQTTNTYSINYDISRGDFNAAVYTALAIAQTTILTSHRDTRVTIMRTLWPEIDLKHTVQLAATGFINCKGKVYSINHVLDFFTGEAVTTVILCLSRSLGSQATSGFSVPAVNDPPDDPGTTTISLGNHFGEDPTQPAAKAWNGFIGNKIRTDGVLGMTNYQSQFIMDTTPIPVAVTNAKNVYGSATYNIGIPNDDLAVTL